jgi:hypothetical protein
MLKKLKPKFLENSRFPVWLSYIVPIEVHAVSIGPFVWCRSELSESTKRHETIHFQQQLELGFVFQWLLYGAFYLYGYAKHKAGSEAYMSIPFEKEAYANADVEGYLANRPRYAWLKHIRTSI